MSTKARTIEPNPVHAWLAAALVYATATQDQDLMNEVARELARIGVNEDALAVMVSMAGARIEYARNRDPDGYLEELRRVALLTHEVYRTYCDIQNLPGDDQTGS